MRNNMQDAILLSRNIFLILALAPFACCSISEKIPLGAIFDQGSDDVQTAFKYAISNHNQNESGRRFELQAYVDVINTKDAFKLSRLSKYAKAPGKSGQSTPPYFAPSRPPTCNFQVLPPSSGFLDYATSMRPEYHQAIIDTIKYYGWRRIIYLYDSNDGLLRLQQIYQALTPGNEPFQVKTVRRINNVTDALQFLRGLEEQSRWEHKHVVLDCSADMAKDIVVGHPFRSGS
ncbi:hypothetical protein HUJ04_008677 [Dendroctonus ponderosae]|nr:hypothetical protein HUJ04_008677 [Dendroctonus ponderosae]